MFKVKLDIDYNLTVANPGRGQYKVVHNGWPVVLEGYGGENSVSILFTILQNRTIHLTIVSSCCDSPAKVVSTTFSASMCLESYINSTLLSMQSKAERDLDIAEGFATL